VTLRERLKSTSSDGYLYNGEQRDLPDEVVRRANDRSAAPGFLTRIKAAITAFKSLPFPQYTGNVPSWNSWPQWSPTFTQKNPDPSTSSLVMAGVRWLGNRLPEAPLTVQQPLKDDDESESVPNHSLLKLFKRPNPFMSASTLWKAFGFSWILKGDVYFIKFRNDLNQVGQIWYEPHWNVKPRWVNDNQGSYIRGANDDPNTFITYYEVMREGQPVRVEVEDVIHFRDGIDPRNTRCGLSGIATILREILSDSQVVDFSSKLLGNSGVPPYVLSIDNKIGNLKQEDIAGVKASLIQQTSGSNSGKPLVVAYASVHKLGFTPEELDLRVSRYLGEERFCAVTGIPAVCLELGSGAEHAIYNNVQQAEQRAAKGYLVPLWWHIDEELTVQLLRDFDTDESRFVEHDLSEVAALQEDETAKHGRVVLDFQGGLITRAQGLAQLDLPADTKPDKTGLDDVYCLKSGSAFIPANLPASVPAPAPEPGLDMPLDDVPTNGGKELPA